MYAKTRGSKESATYCIRQLFSSHELANPWSNSKCKESEWKIIGFENEFFHFCDV